MAMRRTTPDKAKRRTMSTPFTTPAGESGRFPGLRLRRVDVFFKREEVLVSLHSEEVDGTELVSDLRCLS